MHTNVEIIVREGQRVITHHKGHNVWVDPGREYLARTIAMTSPITTTTPGTVDLVASFPALTNEFFRIRIGHSMGLVEYRVQLASPASAAALLSQINAQVSGLTASLGGGNGLIFTPSAPVGVEIVSGTALARLGVSPAFYQPSGMTSTPLDTRRVKYMGFGIGSKLQSLAAANDPPLGTAYPPGFDPNATAGNAYDKDFPKGPLITSLERPVRITGGADPYPGDPADVWLVQAPKFTSYIVSPGVIRFHGVVDCPAGDMVYAPFTLMPVSEVGLFLSDADVNDAYNAGKLVAYHSFGTIPFTSGVTVDLSWTVSF